MTGCCKCIPCASPSNRCNTRSAGWESDPPNSLPGAAFAATDGKTDNVTYQQGCLTQPCILTRGSRHT